MSVQYRVSVFKINIYCEQTFNQQNSMLMC